jgi:hypothetical protein
MLKRSVLGIGAYAAACISAIPVCANDIYPPPPKFTLNANDISLRCIAYVGPDGPWTGTLNYRINLSDSTVNGEVLQIDRSDANGPKLGDILHPHWIYAKRPMLGWHAPANESVPAAYLLDLSNGRLDVTFEYDGRRFQRFRLQCTNKLLKLAA